MKNDMETVEYHGNTVEHWKQNAEENYLTTPISVLKYITVLEEQADQLQKYAVSERGELLRGYFKWHKEQGFVSHKDSDIDEFLAINNY